MHSVSKLSSLIVVFRKTSAVVAKIGVAADRRPVSENGKRNIVRR